MREAARRSMDPESGSLRLGVFPTLAPYLLPQGRWGARMGEAKMVDPVLGGLTDPAEDAARSGVRLEVVKHHEAKRGFVLLPRRWVVERSFAWAARFRRLARDYERLPQTLAGLHFVAFVTLMLAKATAAFDLVRNTV